MSKTVVKYPHSILSNSNKKVTAFGGEFQKLVDELIQAKDKNNGLGLAAPQIGQNVQAIAIGYEPRNEKQDALRIPHLILVNPKITYQDSHLDEQHEGCLSLPGLELPVRRAAKIRLIAQNRWGKKIKLEVSGFLARVLQHEIDHLNGILILERAVKSKENQKKIQEYLKDCQK